MLEKYTHKYTYISDPFEVNDIEVKCKLQDPKCITT